MLCRERVISSLCLEVNEAFALLGYDTGCLTLEDGTDKRVETSLTNY